MPSLSSFFAWELHPGMLVYGDHDPWLVLLSIALAVFSSTMGLQAASQARQMSTRGMRELTLTAASLALGSGVWAMHFVGMLAFHLCTAVDYDTRTTLLSLLPSLAASRVALGIIARDTVSGPQLALGGLLVGSGIGAMHYLGMAAMQMSAALRYDPFMFAVSIVVAVSLAMLSLWVRFGVARSALGMLPGGAQSVIGGSVMGLAIAGMHYTGMAAARFIGAPQSDTPMSLPEAHTIALSIALVSMATTALVAGAAGLARYRQLIERLKAKGARLRAISQSSIDGIIVFDHAGIVQEFNPGAQRIYGWQPHEVIGQHIGMLMEPRTRRMAEADFAAFLDALKPEMNGERDTVAPGRDGQDIPIRLVVAPMAVPGASLYVAFVSNIAERVRMAHELQESEAQFRSLITNISGAAYRCRMENGWPMLFISDAVEEVTGYPAADFLGDPPRIRLADLVPKEDLARVARQVEQEAHRDHHHFLLEFQLRHRDGSMRWIWASGALVRDGEQGNAPWIDGVLLDITGRREMEDNLRIAKEKAEAAAQARSTFLANMSHEIRTPMNAIIGFTEVVLAGELLEAQRKHLETVHKAARNLLYLLNDILDTSKLEQNAVALEQLDFSLPELVQQLSAEQSLHARRKQLKLAYEIAPDVGEYVKGDPHRLRQILLNLVGNAIKFTERGSVQLQVHRLPEGVCFSVRDTGIGIAPERLPHIFDAFTQADASMSRRFGGTGLGTTIAKQLTELMQGRIWVESTVGQGSAFHVLLPLTAGDPANAARLSQDPRGLRLAPMRILAVDDVPQNLELLTLLLGRHGHTVVTADDGQRALEAAKQAPFDIILMDVQMPVMDGLAACQALREHERTSGQPRTPVLALSASVLHEDRQATIDAGMDGFAGKPVDMAELMREIARVTGRSPLPEASDGDIVNTPMPLLAASHDVSEDWPVDPGLIDTRQAMPLWQDGARYLQALQRFASAHAAWHRSEGSDKAAPVMPALQEAFATAHRIKGAAANLGLTRIITAAAELESQARLGKPDGAQQAWQALHQAFHDTLPEIARLSARREEGQPLAHAAHASSATTTATTTGATPLTDMALPALHSKIAHLRTAFQRGECLDALLAEVKQGLRPWVAAADIALLGELVDVFDFDAAASTLTRMAEALPALPDEPDQPDLSKRTPWNDESADAAQ